MHCEMSGNSVNRCCFVDGGRWARVIFVSLLSLAGGGRGGGEEDALLTFFGDGFRAGLEVD